MNNVKATATAFVLAAAVVASAGAIAAAPVAPRATARAPDSLYQWQAPRSAGAAVLSMPEGGQYVYRDRIPQDGRPAGRFVIGKPGRSEYALFSAEEEAALWELRQLNALNARAQLEALEPPAPIHRRVVHKRAAVRQSAGLTTPLDWPKVLATPEKVCVPEIAFAESADWTQHLRCWMKGAAHVE